MITLNTYTMKRFKLYCTIPVLFLVLVKGKAQQNLTFGVNPVRNSSQLSSASSEVSAAWYNQVVANLHQIEYAFYPQCSDRFRAANSRNGIGFFIEPDGYAVHHIRYGPHQNTWQTVFKICGIARDKNRPVPLTRFHAEQKKETVVYTSKKLNVEYSNDEAGLRQNFEIKSKPQGVGNVKIILQVKSDLQPKMTEPNRLCFYDSGNILRLTYEDLNVWDAKHCVLASHMEYDQSMKELSLVVDDSNASYPILIDPLSKTPEWQTSAGGVISTLLTQTQLQATLYGYTVTGLGDVNGDGFGDAAV